MTPIRLFAVGVVLLAFCGFFSPCWWLGFAPLGAGAVWAAYDLVDVKDGERDDTSGTPPRH